MSTDLFIEDRLYVTRFCGPESKADETGSRIRYSIINESEGIELSRKQAVQVAMVLLQDFLVDGK